ncbi:hypothetical protein Taro_037229 [Colocasia esculenta]|uniref:Uncharacterized protein n=1 Tax=Colocasia esculenta TaxID=4460 RepID=A0A843W942_COLES|nr:hypothetical protein [Colocasia esculenta]
MRMRDQGGRTEGEREQEGKWEQKGYLSRRAKAGSPKAPMPPERVTNKLIPLFIDLRILVTNRLIPVTNSLIPVTNMLIPVTNSLIPLYIDLRILVTNRLIPVTNRLIPVINRLIPVHINSNILVTTRLIPVTNRGFKADDLKEVGWQGGKWKGSSRPDKSRDTRELTATSLGSGQRRNINKCTGYLRAGRGPPTLVPR